MDKRDFFKCFEIEEKINKLFSGDYYDSKSIVWEVV